jgi:hypothetical protein
MLERLQHDLDGLGDVREFGADGGDDAGVLVVDDAEDLLGGGGVEPHRAGVPLLGSQGLEFVEEGGLGHDYVWTCGGESVWTMGEANKAVIPSLSRDLS